MNNAKNKRRYSISGRETGTSLARKRYRSNEEIQDRKKGRRHQVETISSESEESDNLTDTDENAPKQGSVTNLRERLDLLRTEDMDEKNFTRLLASALRNEEISNLMTNTFERTIEVKIKPVKDSIEKVERENIERDDRLAKLEGKCSSLEVQVDEYDQSKRDKNIIISGLESDKFNQDGVLEFLKTIPGTNESSISTTCSS